jgi:hypothetical protein
MSSHVVGGEHEIHWDGRDDRGGAAGAGTYFLRLRTAEGQVMQKVTLLR